MRFLIWSILLLFLGLWMLYTTIKSPEKTKEDWLLLNIRGYVFGSMSIVLSIILFLEYLNFN